MASSSNSYDSDNDNFHDNFWPPLELLKGGQQGKWALDDEDPADTDLVYLPKALLHKRKNADAASTAFAANDDLFPKKLNEVIWTTRQMPTVSPAEMERAVMYPCVKLQRFNDPADPTEAGRVIVHFGEAVKNPLFQLECPTLCALYKAYQAASKSFCIMITWRDALWLHCDMRALVEGISYDKGSIADYIKAKLAGSGPDESIVLVGHQIDGVTELTYGVVEECSNKEKTFRRPKKDPSKVPDEMKESIVRVAGEVTESPVWLHAACATATPGPGGLEVSKIAFDNVGLPRLMHAASGKGAGGYAISILASVWKPRKAALYAELGKIHQFQDATRCDEDEDESTHESFFAEGGPFRRAAAEFAKARPSGTGGLTDEEHKQASCGDQPIKNIGLVRKNSEDGSYFSLTRKEHGADCTRGKEKPGGHAHAVWEPSDAERNCDLLDALTGLKGWVSRTRPLKGGKSSAHEYSHSSGLKALKFVMQQAKRNPVNITWMTYMHATEVGRAYAAAEGKKQKRMQPELRAFSFGAAGSSSAPVEL